MEKKKSKQLTVSELIERLKALRGDSPVYFVSGNRRRTYHQVRHVSHVRGEVHYDPDHYAIISAKEY